MSYSLADIRAGLVANLASIDGAQISPYILANWVAPAIHVFPAEITYHDGAGHGTGELITFTVQGFVGQASNRAAQMRLDEWLAPDGATSVKAAIESDTTLGGVVSEVTVMSATGARTFITEGKPPMLGCEWTVQVVT